MCGTAATAVAQQTVANAAIRNTAQLLLDPLDGTADRGAARERVVDIDVGSAQPDGMQRRKPADGAREIEVPVQRVAAVPLNVDDNARLFAPAAAAPPGLDGDAQCGQQ